MRIGSTIPDNENSRVFFNLQSCRTQVVTVGNNVMNKGLVHGVEAKACAAPKSLVGRIQVTDATELLVVKQGMNAC